MFVPIQILRRHVQRPVVGTMALILQSLGLVRYLLVGQRRRRFKWALLCVSLPYNPRTPQKVA